MATLTPATTLSRRHRPAKINPSFPLVAGARAPRQRCRHRARQPLFGPFLTPFLTPPTPGPPRVSPSCTGFDFSASFLPVSALSSQERRDHRPASLERAGSGQEYRERGGRRRFRGKRGLKSWEKSGESRVSGFSDRWIGGKSDVVVGRWWTRLADVGRWKPIRGLVYPPEGSSYIGEEPMLVATRG